MEDDYLNIYCEKIDFEFVVKLTVAKGMAMVLAHSVFVICLSSCVYVYVCMCQCVKSD